MKATVILDDVDQHGALCGCGDCGSNGKSYGAAIVDISGFEPEPEWDLEEQLVDFIQNSPRAEVLWRVYGPSEEAALQVAYREATGPMGLEVVGYEQASGESGEAV